MNEYLILRLASQADQSMPWLVWSEQEHEVIASGEVASADRLHELKPVAAGRTLIGLAPAIDTVIRQLPLPRKNRRQALAALPFMLEDELAQDVEQVHFSVYQQDKTSASLAYLSHSKMALWLAWLTDADLKASRIVPEGLALPETSEPNWHFIQLGEQWILRCSASQVLALDNEACLSLWLDHQVSRDVTLISHTPWPESLATRHPAQVELAELPLAALIQGALHCSCNLRNGRYVDTTSKPVTAWRPWLKVAGFAGGALLMYLTSVGLELKALHQQEQTLKEEIQRTFALAFPNAKNVSDPRKQLQQELNKIGGTAITEGSFLEFLQDLLPIYQRVGAIKVESLRFDGKRNELRIQASAADFQQFEKFKAAIGNGYMAELGALNSNDGKVAGTITIRRAS